jgi:hypothetical protein
VGATLDEIFIVMARKYKPEFKNPKLHSVMLLAILAVISNTTFCKEIWSTRVANFTFITTNQMMVIQLQGESLLSRN